MPIIPTISDCTFIFLALGLFTCRCETVSGHGTNRSEAYRNMLDNFYDAHCEKLDSTEAWRFYRAIQSARFGVIR